VTIPSSNISGTISLTLSYDGPFDGVGFTATAYSGLGMRWDGPLRALPFDHRISGTLTSKTSGGNYTLPTYMINPQYCLRVPATTQDGPPGKTRIKASLRAARDLPINVVVTWGRGKRVFEWAHASYMHVRKWFLTFKRASLAQSDIIATSGAYTYGFAQLSADLPRTSAVSWHAINPVRSSFSNFILTRYDRGRLHACRICFFTYTPRRILAAGGQLALGRS
jgi:calpain-7